ncbi:MAG: hypothetical protein M0Q12_00220 [Synergistaceae bacterium]|jgi:hypothetical protein|nr:hypothetical protein [Synergistaceae bacterium]
MIIPEEWDSLCHNIHTWTGPVKGRGRREVMKALSLVLFVMMAVLALSVAIIGCADEDDDDDDCGDDEDGKCWSCVLTMECRSALGKGYVCEKKEGETTGCCVEADAEADDDDDDDDDNDDDNDDDDDDTIECNTVLLYECIADVGESFFEAYSGCPVDPLCENLHCTTQILADEYLSGYFDCFVALGCVDLYGADPYCIYDCCMDRAPCLEPLDSCDETRELFCDIQCEECQAACQYGSAENG